MLAHNYHVSVSTNKNSLLYSARDRDRRSKQIEHLGKKELVTFAACWVRNENGHEDNLQNS
jgi:hypothetical protein